MPIFLALCGEEYRDQSVIILAATTPLIWQEILQNLPYISGLHAHWGPLWKLDLDGSKGC
jgi:hypothetical protein